MTNKAKRREWEKTEGHEQRESEPRRPFYEYQYDPGSAGTVTRNGAPLERVEPRNFFQR